MIVATSSKKKCCFFRLSALRFLEFDNGMGAPANRFERGSPWRGLPAKSAQERGFGGQPPDTPREKRVF